MKNLNHFIFEVGGHGDLQTLRLMEDGVIVVKLGQAKIPWFYKGDLQHKPNQEKWSEFIAKLDAINVWDWEASYHRTDMCDGSMWELHLSTDNKSIKSYGSGLFPEKFDELKAAIEQLLS